MTTLRLLDDTYSKFHATSGTASGAAVATGAPGCPIERRANLRIFPLARQIALHSDWAVSGAFKMQTRLNSKGTVMCADGKLVAMIGADANDAPALAAPGRNGATNNKSGKGGG